MILLEVDDVDLALPAGRDSHGWNLPGEDDWVWSGKGNLQLQPGISDRRMAGEGGGRGPFGPARDNYGQLYLPPEAPVLEGMTARVRSRLYGLSQTRFVRDPLGVAGDADCWVTTVTSFDTWPVADQPVPDEQEVTV